MVCGLGMVELELDVDGEEVSAEDADVDGVQRAERVQAQKI